LRNCGILFYFGKEFLGICFDKERNKMAEKKNNKTKQAIIFMSFCFLIAAIYG
jgi:hypothetical protein